MDRNSAYNLEASVTGMLGRRSGLFIDGALRDMEERPTLPVHDPATGEVIADVGSATESDVDQAVRSAHAAFADGRWRFLRPADRERILLRLADLVEQRAEAFAQLASLEQGKSINIARAIEVGASIDWIRFAAGLATKITGRTFDTSLPGGPEHWTTYTRREPVGVVAAITPWNFPLMIAVWKVLPALAAGCSVVLKPAETTPLTALMLANVALEAGVPPGVFNVVVGPGSVTGRALVEHALISKISFTGSTATGKAIGTSAIASMKRFTLELGGKSPAIVLKDADLAKAVPGLIAGGFLNGGQVCAAATRVYVEAPLYDDLVGALHDAIGGMRAGPGLDPEAQINPLSSAQHKERVNTFLAEAQQAGGEVRLGGEVPEVGFYARAALVLGPTEAMRLTREEVFGPILTITKVDSADEAVARANDSDMGLTASIWTSDIDAAMTLTRRVEAGTVWVNSHVFIDPAMPFGGYKQSGVGRDFGVDWLDGFTELKSVCINH